jgi:hypothetical protein
MRTKYKFLLEKMQVEPKQYGSTPPHHSRTKLNQEKVKPLLVEKSQNKAKQNISSLKQHF